jgi:uncharacterized protein DUF4339
MKANWYYIENDETVGPITFADLAGRIRQSGQSPLVWTEGMADWTEAESVPALSQALQTATRSSASSRFERAGTERNVASKACRGNYSPSALLRPRHSHSHRHIRRHGRAAIAATLTAIWPCSMAARSSDAASAVEPYYRARA